MINLADSIYIFHYSKNVPLKFVITEELPNNTLRIVAAKREDLTVFSVNDPVVVCLTADNDFLTLGGDILGIDLKNSFLEIKVVYDDSVWQGKRQFERYPASLYADIRSKSISKRSLALIKDICYSGMLISSKAVIPENEEFDMDLYAEKLVIPLKVKAVRTNKFIGFSEYGLQVVYSNYGSMEAMKQYVQSLKDFHKNSIKKLELFEISTKK